MVSNGLSVGGFMGTGLNGVVYCSTNVAEGKIQHWYLAKYVDFNPLIFKKNI